jgi:hypothetical protein
VQFAGARGHQEESIDRDRGCDHGADIDLEPLLAIGKVDGMEPAVFAADEGEDGCIQAGREYTSD